METVETAPASWHVCRPIKSLGSSLEECEVESLEDEIDRTALLCQIRTTIHRFEDEEPHTREFDVTGRVMKGWARVMPAGTWNSGMW